jgi:RNA polymerase sigma factor (TIGR02999 family)
MQNYQISEADTALVSSLQTDLALRLADQIPKFYQDIKQLASRERMRLLGQSTLHTTEIVNELYLKFARNAPQSVASVEHFMALCAIAIRHFLVDRARRAVLAKTYQGTQLAEHAGEGKANANTLDDGMTLAVHDALLRLEQFNPRLARVVECRWFAGYTEPETAQVLGIAERTVRRDWQKAQMWLSTALT